MVRRRAGPAHAAILMVGGRGFPCALGRSGVTGRKVEGDGATPRGVMRLLAGRFRTDRVKRPGGSFWHRIESTDGWCDAPFDANYNRPVRKPCRVSHETMMRDDHLYDRLIVLDWNIASRAHGRGSAIFFHQARIGADGFGPTEGCIAVDAEVFRKWAPVFARLKAIRVL